MNRYFLRIAIIGASIAVFAPAMSFAATDAEGSAGLQAQITSDNEQIAALNRKIAVLQAELLQVGADKKTLQSAIRTLDIQRNKVEAQVSVTQHQINSTQLQINQLGGEITDTQQIIATDQAALAEYLRNIQQTDNEAVLIRVLLADNLIQFWDRVNANLQVQRVTREKTRELQAREDTLAGAQDAVQQKQNALATQKKSLASQQRSLSATVLSKSQLLTQTKAQESTYQKLLAAAQTELQSYSTFTQNAGGSNLLTGQTICDSWGCYYNQRDAAWGNLALNGTKYTLASDGCLVTSMAMMMTHYGFRGVTPVSINSNPANFASYYPAYLLYSISVNGVTATRKVATIDASLATGNPVVVGVHAYGGTHFVVLVSGSKGNYLMRDPYIANGNNISFSANYAVNKIFSIYRVEIN